MTYYKVVTQSLRSIMETSLPENVAVQYEIGEWVQPNIPGSSLMVFSRINYATAFLNSSDLKGKIFEAEAEDISFRGFFLTSFYGLTTEDFKLKAARVKGYLVDTRFTMLAPLGTLFAGAVKLIKEIKVL